MLNGVHWLPPSEITLRRVVRQETRHAWPLTECTAPLPLTAPNHGVRTFPQSLNLAGMSQEADQQVAQACLPLLADADLGGV